MTFTFEDAKLMYQSGIFKLITYRSLKRKLLKAKEIQAGLDNNAPQLYIKQYLIEQYINKLNIVQEKFRKTSSGISDLFFLDKMQLFFQKCLKFLDILCFFRRLSTKKRQFCIFWIKVCFFYGHFYPLFIRKKIKACGLGRSFAKAQPIGLCPPTPSATYASLYLRC